MHAFFAPFGIYPNNAIVGGSGSIAPGAALYKRANRKPGIVVANIGDASFGCGPVWEGITFASMDQYRKLWDPALGGGLPIIFNCMDNFYGMGGQPDGETMGLQLIARIGAGVNPEQMHAERVNGYNPLAVIDAFERKKQRPRRRARAGPAGHHHLPLSAATRRRTPPATARREEIEHWQAADCHRRPTATCPGRRRGEGVDAWTRRRTAVEELVFDMFRLAVGPRGEPPPRGELRAGRQRHVLRPAGRALRRPRARAAADLAENPRVQQIAGKVRTAVGRRQSRCRR